MRCSGVQSSVYMDMNTSKRVSSLYMSYTALELGEDGDANANATRLRQRKKVIERQDSKAVNITADEDIVRNLQVGWDRDNDVDDTLMVALSYCSWRVGEYAQVFIVSTEVLYKL